MLFKDWRLLDQTSVSLPLDKEYVYYIHAQAWAMKGYLGGTHSWITFWSGKHNKWLVAEKTDIETVEVQNANVLWIRDGMGYCDKGPIISDRIPDAKWFGAIPRIVGKSKSTFKYEDIVQACEEYPIAEFKLLTQNCNTFSSYIVSTLNLDIKKPLLAYGYRRTWTQTKKQY